MQVSQHVVVEHEQAAAKAIDYLKMNRLGRATFLPLTIIKEKRLPDAVQQQLFSLQGYVGIASDLVHVDKNVSIHCSKYFRNNSLLRC